MSGRQPLRHCDVGLVIISSNTTTTTTNINTTIITTITIVTTIIATITTYLLLLYHCWVPSENSMAQFLFFFFCFLLFPFATILLSLHSNFSNDLIYLLRSNGLIESFIVILLSR